MSEDRRGVMLGLAAAVSFGISAPLAKRLLGHISSAQLLAGLLYLGACGALIVGRRLRRGTSEARLRRADLPTLGGLILSGGVVAPVLLLLGLQRLGGARGSLLLNLEGPATLALAVLVFREHLDRRALMAATAIFGGAALLSWVDPSGVRSGLGVVCIAGACVMWAIDNNLTQRLTVRDPFSVVIVKTGAAGTINTALAIALGAGRPSTPSIVLALALGGLSYGVSVLLDAYALRLLGAAREAAIFGAAPFIGAAVSVVWFGDRLTALEFVGALAMAVGVGVMLRERHGHHHRHVPIDHDHLHAHDEHHQHEHGLAEQQSGSPHAHAHRHTDLAHSHGHVSDVHHRHEH